jgi:hypothetical protein
MTPLSIEQERIDMRWVSEIMKHLVFVFVCVGAHLARLLDEVGKQEIHGVSMMQALSIGLDADPANFSGKTKITFPRNLFWYLNRIVQSNNTMHPSLLLIAFGLFYGSVCLPLTKTRLVKTIFPNTSSFELAAAIITVAHTWFASFLGFKSIVTCITQTDYENAVVYGGGISFTYYLFDTIYLICRYRIAVFKNKYLGHHIVAMCITYAASNHTMDAYAQSVMLWYAFVEASNVLLKAWELTKHNLPQMHKLLVTPFICTYLVGRGIAVFIVTPRIVGDMLGDGHLCRSEGYILTLILGINAMSVWFGFRIVRSVHWV